jgi:hypothetical protein
MKKYIIFIVALLCVSLVAATSYELTADLVAPGVFDNSGEFYFPEMLVVGEDSAPTGSASTYGTSLFVEDDNGNNRYGIYVSSSYTDSSTPGRAIYGYASNDIGIKGDTGSDSVSHAGVVGQSNGDAPGVLASSDKYSFYSDGSPKYGLYVEDADSYGVYIADAGSRGIMANGDSYGGYFLGGTSGLYAKGDYYGGYFKGSDSTYGIGVYGQGYQYGGMFYGYYGAPGVYASSSGNAIYGEGDTGVFGIGDNTGVYGESSSSSSKECGVKGYNSNSGKTGYLGCNNNGIYTPDSASVGSCSGCDIAEHFVPEEELEPGDVVVLDADALRGVKKTTEPYSKLAAGIVSTDPTITMGLDNGVPIALSGVVPTKVVGDVTVGDLLTTSSVAGHAMACGNYRKCQGAIIGKAMESSSGEGTIIALVMLG